MKGGRSHTTNTQNIEPQGLRKTLPLIRPGSLDPCGHDSVVVVVVVAVALAMALAVMVAVVMVLVWWSMMINDAGDDDGRSMTTFVFLYRVVLRSQHIIRNEIIAHPRVRQSLFEGRTRVHIKKPIVRSLYPHLMTL